MKAKDIALLCTAAAGAGAAAGIAAANTSKAKPAKETPAPKAKAASKKAERRSAPDLQPATADIKSLAFGTDKPLSAVYSHSDRGIVAVFGSEGRHTVCRADFEGNISEVRCPVGISGAALGEDCVMFITERGGVFVYNDTDREPVLCALTAPEYAAYFEGRFYVFSDSLLYICTPDGEIEKTVSLGAMIEITGSDICDAEDSDSSFTAARVSVKKLLPLGKSGLFAVITAEGNSYIMQRDEDDFVSFEKTYENIIDVCVFGSFAYYLCRLAEGYGIIKTEIKRKNCETAGKYQLCGEDRKPVKIFSVSCGIGVLYEDGGVKFLLPEISSERAREKARRGLSALNGAFGDISVRDVFSFADGCGYISDGNVNTITV
ncbi:MAG: hypothetical protein ACI4J0_03060 [Huintestinicola sp.]|uniref:hypothetical protein n=1 Tax=Huintestinicola sp. TaxID=2981661 RepID=UPI003EFE29D0